MEKLLVAVDGSKASVRALAYAARRVSGRKNMEIHVLYAQRGVEPTKLVNKSMIADWHAQEQKKAFSGWRLRRLMKSTKAQVHVETEEPATAILASARKNRISEIIMGSRGLGRLKGLLVGSVATKVLQLATIPVTVVK